MDIAAYLRRINYQGGLDPTAETLRQLQIAHLQAVPFENLAIHARQPIRLEDGALFDKIVRRRRGGFCYELNGLFAALLRALGFEVAMLSAGVRSNDGDFGPDFDHLALLVTLEERWLVDVGFGDSFQEPLLLMVGREQAQGDRAYRLMCEGDQWLMGQREGDHEWEVQYRFSLQPYQFADYEAMCHYHQSSPQSHFTRKRLCTLATLPGRITLSDWRFIRTERGIGRQEQQLSSEAEFAAILGHHFGIEWPNY